MYEIDCLTNGAPHGKEANSIIHFFEELDSSEKFDVIRIQFVIQVFSRMLGLRYSQYSMQDYADLLHQELSSAKERTKSISFFLDLLENREKPVAEHPLEDVTGAHFAEMFSYFSEEDFFVISPKNLNKLFQINGFSLPSPETKRVLDAGCGSGRYSCALYGMGFGNVTGLDYSVQNIAFARKMTAQKSLNGLNFQAGDVRKLPFGDCEFDFIFSNGVLHHVDAPYTETLAEMYRVMKGGGTGYLYVMEKLGGVLNDTVEICRKVIKDVAEEKTILLMKIMGFNGYRIYAVLDHIYAPINTRVTPEELESVLTEVGFSNISRFQRGLISDDTERLHHQKNDSEAVWKFGVGENRYTFTK